MSTSDKKIALITGANRGIGYEITRQLGKLGYLVLIGSRDKKPGQAATDRLRAEGIDAYLQILDVTHHPSLVRAHDFIQNEYGRLDVLVNNAGILHDKVLKPSETPLDTVREAFEPNFFGVVAITQILLPLLRKSA